MSDNDKGTVHLRTVTVTTPATNPVTFCWSPITQHSYDELLEQEYNNWPEGLNLFGFDPPAPDWSMAPDGAPGGWHLVVHFPTACHQ